MYIHLGATVRDNKEMSTTFRMVGPSGDDEDFTGEEFCKRLQRHRTHPSSSLGGKYVGCLLSSKMPMHDMCSLNSVYILLLILYLYYNV